jgi:hypothetical protein
MRSLDGAFHFFVGAGWPGYCLLIGTGNRFHEGMVEIGQGRVFKKMRNIGMRTHEH